MQFFNVIAVFGLAALAAAAPQASDSMVSPMAATPTSSSSAAGMTASTAPGSPITSCITGCGTDLCCKAACVGVPCPNPAQVDATTECAMSCNQGNGSAVDTKNYGDCQSACISSLFLTSTGAAAATGTNSRAAGNSASTTSSSGSARVSASSTASSSDSAASASSSSTGNGASSIQIGASTAGFLSLLMAALAL